MREEVLVRRRSKVVFYAHFVWTTKGRQDRLTASLEREVYRCIVDEAEALDCEVLAIGGMPDHVHLLVRMPGKLSPSVLARQIKGLSSSLMNRLRPPYSDLFRWQDGYGCMTLSQEHIPAAIAYVRHQKQHHANDTLRDNWEETYEEEILPPTGGRLAERLQTSALADGQKP